MLRVWSRYPNISRKIRALGGSGLMLSFVSRYLDTAIKSLHLFFYILHTEDNRRQYTFHNHFRMAHCYLSRCNPPIKKTKRKNIFLKEEHFIHQQIMPSRSKDILHSVLALTIQDVKHLKIISVTSTDA